MDPSLVKILGTSILTLCAPYSQQTDVDVTGGSPSATQVGKRKLEALEGSLKVDTPDATPLEHQSSNLTIHASLPRDRSNEDKHGMRKQIDSEHTQVAKRSRLESPQANCTESDATETVFPVLTQVKQ